MRVALAILLFGFVQQCALAGAHEQQKQPTALTQILRDGAAAPQAAPSKVVFVPAKQLDSEIHKALERRPRISWIDFVDTPKYSASVIRRTAPDRAEVHKGVTDIWYVIQGGGTLVTGGSLTEVSQTEPDELRGRSISGGENRQIGKGDFLRIPTGVPHWVQKIDGKELVYLVVKVASPIVAP